MEPEAIKVGIATARNTWHQYGVTFERKRESAQVGISEAVCRIFFNLLNNHMGDSYTAVCFGQIFLGPACVVLNKQT
jgi:hypothetical protein